MTEKRTRAKREPIPMAVIMVQGTILDSAVPTQQGRQSGSPRKWQGLANQVRDASLHEEWLVVKLSMHYDPDVVRSGIKEELKRTHHRLDWRLARDDEKESYTMYLSAKGN